MRPEQLRERSEAIRLSRKAVSSLSGLVEETIGRTFRGATSPNLATCDIIEKALIAEELRLRDYLVGLHPLPAAASGEAAA